MEQQQTTGFLDALYNNWTDPIWWADNGSNYVIFSILFGIFFGLTRYALNKWVTRKYYGWEVVLEGLASQPEPQVIFWQDMQKNLESPFEKWKFIKSAVSSICWIDTPSIKEAEERWLRFEDKKIIVNFGKMDTNDTDIAKLQSKLSTPNT